MSVLVLNASYEPLTVVTLRRAVCLVLSGRAELVEEEEGRLIRAAGGFEVVAPAVVRLIQMVKVPFRATAPLNRRTLAARDGGRCQRVGCDRTGNTIDHVVPRSRGGGHTWENVTLMCGRCNAMKDDRLLSEMGWKLKSPPRAPRGTLVLVAAASARHAPAWAPYLVAS